MKKKRIVVCFDGTWQSLRQDRHTNVAVIAKSVAHTETISDSEHIQQIVIYAQGVGSGIDALKHAGWLRNVSAFFDRLGGGLFGEGIEDIVVDAYIRLAFNYEHGDELYIFGFSRGAFAARQFTGLLNCAGIVSRLHVEKAWLAYDLYRDTPTRDGKAKEEHEVAARNFRRELGKGMRDKDTGARIPVDEPPEITYLGVFDTVAQRGLAAVLGIVSKHVQRRLRFRYGHIAPNVRSARHAVAIDENGWGFRPTLLEDDPTKPGQSVVEQRWFAGRHGDIGGGGSELAALALNWIAKGAADHGLRFYEKHGDDCSPLDRACREPLRADAPMAVRGFPRMLLPQNWPIAPRRIWRGRKGPTQTDCDGLISPTVRDRTLADYLDPRYKPGPLRPFRNYLWLVPPPDTKAGGERDAA